MAPQSAGQRPPMDNATYAENIFRLTHVLNSFPFTIKEISDNPTENQVLVWGTAVPEWKEEVMDGEKTEWEYVGEYMFLINFEEGGEKINRIVEFLDSKATESLHGLMKRAMQNLALSKTQKS